MPAATSTVQAQPAPLALPARSHKSTLIGMAAPVPAAEAEATAPETAAPAPTPADAATVDSLAAAAAAPSVPPRSEAAASAPEPNFATTSSEPVATSVPSAGHPSSLRPAREGRGSRWLLLAAAALGILVLGGRYLMRGERVEPEAATPAAVTVVPPVQNPPAAADAPGSAPTGAEAAQSSDSTALATPPPASASPPASAAAADSATAPSSAAPADSAAAATSAPLSGDELINTKRTVVVTISPPNARLFRRGKPVGASPVTIELEPGEKRRLYEVGGRGWVTRKLSVDGSKPEIFIGLKPDPATALPAGKPP